MSVVAEPAVSISTVPPGPVQSTVPTTAPIRRQVVIAIDAYCEIAPHIAQQLGIVVIPRMAKVDSQQVILNAEQTLHHSCWTQPPRRVVPALHTLGGLAQSYEQVLNEGLSILAIHQPLRFDDAVHFALAARSILLAGPQSTREHPPRVAVCELGAVGAGFEFLVQIAARGAAKGMTLQQLLTLIDRTQSMLKSYYVTTRSGPIANTRSATRLPKNSLRGTEQIWELDQSADGLFTCLSRSRHALQELFSPEGLFGNQDPNIVRTNNTRLLGRLNKVRALMQKAPFEIDPGGLAFTSIFPHGCIELTVLPNESEINRIVEIIRRIDRTVPALVRGLRQRGGL
ncbi:MAG: hypothetical protein GFH27_549293n115 [Chloroflexi bacterium AL-W]|nr:hypothetical protein [Chloroflexi bacterium AL-N1]NOK67770.1 hypothetical protein [Chloroflexi bacterium AL-N10]NOK75460.1 hypothetical protein [Chloroflexi bacterium AL-N5]NOK82248.1 hypothetical protein [Chloroflexi bacterium AL-W]NOK90093.1 hypothetical protein [Chloroflexi bacterium AL-N15]